MASDTQVVSAQLAFNSTYPTVFDFNDADVTGGGGGSVQRLILKTDEDCYLGFDTAANSADFLLEASDEPIYIDAQVTRVSALGASASGTLYIIGIR